MHYLHSLRKREYVKIFKHFASKKFDRVLEIGSGDGFQASLLKKNCRFFVASDLTPPIIQRNNINYIVCDTQNLPLKPNSFDMIFSSSVLEHVQDQISTLEQLKTVLKKNGIMIHVVPTRTWKALQLVCYYPYALSYLLKKIANIASKEKRPHRNPDNYKHRTTRLFSTLKMIFPPIHGEYQSHWREFSSYGKKSWKKLFEKSALEIKDTMDLVLCTGYGFGFNKIRILGENAGLYSTCCFIVIKPGSVGVDVR